jgi:hypothetical protein
MNTFLPLGKYSFGMGDRFAHQGKAQLQACVLATELGADFIPVWNKSNREHTFIGTEPASTRGGGGRGGAKRSAGKSPTMWTPTISASKRWTASSPLGFFHH